MKSKLVLALFAFALSAVFSRADETKLHPPVTPTPDYLTGANAEEDLQRMGAKLDEIFRSKLPTDKAERAAAQQQNGLKQFASALAFYEKYPDSPGRWRAVYVMGSLTDILTLEDGSPKVAVDGEWPTSAWFKWRQEIQALQTRGVVATDTEPGIRFRLEIGLPGGLLDQLIATRQALEGGKPADLAALRLGIDGLAVKYPDEKSMGSIIESYMRLRTTAGASVEELKAEWQLLAGNANEHIRAVAEQELIQLDALSKPIEIAFTAVDGTEVDLKQLRGKVVLIDFWATWCGPCIAELPNIKQVYAAYHDKGFEIVGISLENGKLTPKDTPEQMVAKLGAAKKVLTDFTSKEEMPWPQHFDGKYWKNEFAVKYGIQSIPAMFLLDQDGKLVTTAARGEKLEQEVKRLLKL